MRRPVNPSDDAVAGNRCTRAVDDKRNRLRRHFFGRRGEGNKRTHGRRLLFLDCRLKNVVIIRYRPAAQPKRLGNQSIRSSERALVLYQWSYDEIRFLRLDVLPKTSAARIFEIIFLNCYKTDHPIFV